MCDVWVISTSQISCKLPCSERIWTHYIINQEVPVHHPPTPLEPQRNMVRCRILQDAARSLRWVISRTWERSAWSTSPWTFATWKCIYWRQGPWSLLSSRTHSQSTCEWPLYTWDCPTGSSASPAVDYPRGRSNCSCYWLHIFSIGMSCDGIKSVTQQQIPIEPNPVLHSIHWTLPSSGAKSPVLIVAQRRSNYHLGVLKLIKEGFIIIKKRFD